MRKITYIRASYALGIFLLWLGVWVAFSTGTFEGLVAGLFFVTLTGLLMPDIGRLYVPKPREDVEE